MPGLGIANDNKIKTESELKIMEDEVQTHFISILKILGFDMNLDQNLNETPKRIAKMYVRELLKGCYEPSPKITFFVNTKQINSMIVLGPIRVNSLCSHHFVPFVGEAYIGYIPNKLITGISKLARIVDWFTKRPQIQEELTEQISEFIDEKLQPVGCGVYIKAQHGCMQIRGIQEPNAWMITTSLKGCFLDISTKEEFLHYIKK